MKKVGRHGKRAAMSTALKSAAVIAAFLSGLTVLDAAAVSRASIKYYDIERIEDAPLIDGILDGDIWDSVLSTGEFVQLEPSNGASPYQNTEVRLTYDSHGIYVGARLYDSSPDSINRRMGTRDSFTDADYFGIYLDPYNDGQTAYGFFVSSSGTLVDMRATMTGGEDAAWDAVWDAEVGLDERGWTVEISIPWSALRFPGGNDRIWAMNMFRGITRYNTNNSWSHIPNDVPNWLAYAGELRGIKDIAPPLRLSFLPYLSTTVNADGEDWGYRGGLDMKYGITNNTTLDMMLIPDFSQIRSDDGVLNLSPYEIRYDERRPFFTEGADLFSKAGIFYSRRIGAAPTGAFSVSDSLSEHEIITENPMESPILNATKITGRTSGGTSWGVLYALTDETWAEAEDTLTGTVRSILTGSRTHFNTAVMNRSFGHNSYISLINTHVNRPENDFYANVTGTEMRLSDAQERFALNITAAYSRKYAGGTADTDGFKTWISAGRTGQALTYSLEHWIESDTYDPNDLGYIDAPNKTGAALLLHYSINEGQGRIQGVQTQVLTYAEGLYAPRVYTGSGLEANMDIEFRNNSFAGGSFSTTFTEEHNYHEARVPGREFIKPPVGNMDIWYAGDETKTFSSVYVYAIASRYGDPAWAQFLLWEPHFRISDRLTFFLTLSLADDRNIKGYVSTLSEPDSILFGTYDKLTFENAVEGSFIFSPRSKVAFRLRHYRSAADYSACHLLGDDGYLTDIDRDPSEADRNYNALSLDLNYIWNFMPGSELSVTWKQGLQSSDSRVDGTYISNLSDSFTSAQDRALICKVLWYIDSSRIFGRIPSFSEI